MALSPNIKQPQEADSYKNGYVFKVRWYDCPRASVATDKPARGALMPGTSGADAPRVDSVDTYTDPKNSLVLNLKVTYRAWLGRSGVASSSSMEIARRRQGEGVATKTVQSVGICSDSGASLPANGDLFGSDTGVLGRRVSNVNLQDTDMTGIALWSLNYIGYAARSATP